MDVDWGIGMADPTAKMGVDCSLCRMIRIAYTILKLKEKKGKNAFFC